MPLKRKCFNLSLGATETHTYLFWRANSRQNAYFCAKETRTPSMPVCQMGRGFELTYEEEMTTMRPANFMQKMSALMLCANTNKTLSYKNPTYLGNARPGYFVQRKLELSRMPAGKILQVHTKFGTWGPLCSPFHFVISPPYFNALHSEHISLIIILWR